LCLKELLSIIQTEKDKSVASVTKPIRELVDMIRQSNKISDSSSNMMSFLVDDLLDFAQLNAGKFRKTCTTFDLSEAIQEMVNIQKDKASMGGIRL
jgi:signal transduction histidine kinase